MSKRASSFVLAGALALGVALFPSTSLAGPNNLAAAKELFRKANVRFNLGEYAPALQLYRKAYTLKPLPGFLFNIAQCHFNLDHFEKALAFYQRYLIQRPQAPNRIDVERQIAAATKSIKAGQEAARRAARKASEARRASTSRPAPATATAPASVPTTTRPVIGGEDELRRPKTSKKAAFLLWSGVGVSTALLLTSVITGSIALDKSSEYQDPSTPLARQRELIDSGKTMRTTATATFAVGVAAALGTGLYYWFGYRTSSSVSVGATPLPGGAGLAISCGGAF